MNRVDILEAVKIKNNRVKPFDGKKRYLATGNLSNQGIDNFVFVDYENKPSRADLMVNEGDLILARMKATNKIFLIDCDSEDLIVSTGFLTLKPKDGFDGRYLYHYFRSKKFQQLKDRFCSGATQKAINNNSFKKLKVPHYEIEEQKKIVQIFDATDNLRQKCKEQLALLDDYLKSVFIEIFGDPISNDKKWPLVELNSIIENIDSGWSPVCVDNHRESEDIPVVLKLGAVTYCVFNQSEYKIIPKGVDIKKRVEVQSKDLLFTRKNTKVLVGASVYVFKCERNLLLPDTIFRLNYKNTLVSGIYLWKLFTERGFRKLIQNLATGSAGSMPNISKEKLKKLRMPLPSLNIQNKFASIVEQVEYIKQKMRASLDEMNNHFNALMQRYFE